MRILFFGTYFRFRGKETYVSDEIDSMVDQYPNLKYLIYTVGPFNEKNCLIRYSENILWIQRKNLKNIKVLLLFLKDMIKIFTKFKPDVIHSIYVIESLIMGLLGKVFRVPSIFHSRGMDFNYDPFINIKSNILARIACKLNKRVITVSKAMKLDGLKLNVPQEKVISLYDGIDISLFTPTNKNYNIENRKIEILNVGRFYPVKCQDMLIEVCKKLREDKIDFHLTFTGYGPLENELIDLIKKYNLENWVNIAGYTDHDKIPEILNKADLYVQPSLSEGMPISVIEAMSMKLPVILTRVGGMPELIEQNKGGVLINVNDKNELYNAILYYVKNPNRIMADGERNREFAIRNFNWKYHVKKLYKIYQNLQGKIREDFIK